MKLVGIDIGGTKMRGVAWNGTRILSAHEMHTPKRKADFIRAIRILAAHLIRGMPPVPVGLAVAGVVKGDTIKLCPNIPFVKNWNAAALLGTPVVLDNDARCVARAEARYGNARGAARAFVCTIGTGIGRAYVQRGAVKRVKRFEYPESWEKEYQRMRTRTNRKEVAGYLAHRLFPLVERYAPDRIVIGGSMVARPAFLRYIRTAWHEEGLKSEVRALRFRKNAGALGAALLIARR